MNSKYDVIVIGAGAAGLMCSIEAGKRGKKVLVLEHYHKIGEKIRISGGGRCNFSNLNTAPENFLSNNPSFCKSALKQFTCENFIDFLKRYEINFHEKKLGQLFCNHSSQNIIDMLIKECKLANVEILTNVLISVVRNGFDVFTNLGNFKSKSLVIATGGLSIPKIGATKFGYEIAKQFGLNVIETSVINFLSKHKIMGKADKKNIGIWVRNKKISAIGLKVSKWIVYHGCSININNNLLLSIYIMYGKKIKNNNTANEPFIYI